MDPSGLVFSVEKESVAVWKCNYRKDSSKKHTAVKLYFDNLIDKWQIYSKRSESVSVNGIMLTKSEVKDIRLGDSFVITGIHRLNYVIADAKDASKILLMLTTTTKEGDQPTLSPFGDWCTYFTTINRIFLERIGGQDFLKIPCFVCKQLKDDQTGAPDTFMFCHPDCIVAEANLIVADLENGSPILLPKSPLLVSVAINKHLGRVLPNLRILYRSEASRLYANEFDETLLMDSESSSMLSQLINHAQTLQSFGACTICERLQSDIRYEEVMIHEECYEDFILKPDLTCELPSPFKSVVDKVVGLVQDREAANRCSV